MSSSHMLKDNRFLILNKQKESTHKWADYKHYDDVSEDYPHLGIIVEKPYVVIDFDKQEHGIKCLEILEKLNIKTRTMMTDKGFHLWFTTNKDIPQKVDTFSAIGLRFDTRTSHKGMVVVKRHHKWREWFDYDTVAELPDWLEPVKSVPQYDFIDMVEGDGRDPAIFSWIYPLLNEKYFSTEQIKKFLNMINDLMFKEPLDEVTMDKFVGEQNEIYETYKTNTVYSEPSKHNLFGSQLSKEFHIKSKFSRLFVYRNGTYESDDSYIQQLMVTKCDFIKDTQRQEIMKYLKLATVWEEEDRVAKNFINLQNGLWDINTWELKPHNPNVFDLNQIQASYIEDCYSEVVENFLIEVANYDIEIFDLLCEIIGYTFIKNLSLQKAFIFYGEGGNGKSLFMELLERTIGANNTSHINLHKFTEPYQADKVSGKLLNSFGDIDSKQLENTGELKSAIVGEKITVRPIYGDPYDVELYATFIGALNKWFTTPDDSDGFYRRFQFVHFQNTFKPLSPKQEASFKKELFSQNSLNYMFKLGLIGLERLNEKGEFTMPESSKILMEKFITSNNNITQWIKFAKPNLDDNSLVGVYQEYSNWIKTVNQKPQGLSKFSENISKMYKDEYDLIEKKDGLYFVRRKLR